MAVGVSQEFAKRLKLCPRERQVTDGRPVISVLANASPGLASQDDDGHTALCPAYSFAPAHNRPRVRRSKRLCWYNWPRRRVVLDTMPVLRLNTTYLTTHPAMQADLESNHELRPNILREYVIFTEYRLQEEKVVGLK
jgi:hypothetical protein